MEDNDLNIALDMAVELYKDMENAIEEYTKGIPLGMKPLSTKEKLEWYLNLTPQAKLGLYQQYGPENYTKMVEEMERLKQHSEKATMRAYGLEEL